MEKALRGEFIMNTTDQKEIVENATCPYCNGIMMDGGCRECGWRPEYEYPPMDGYGGIK